VLSSFAILYPGNLVRHFHVRHFQSTPLFADASCLIKRQIQKWNSASVGMRWRSRGERVGGGGGGGYSVPADRDIGRHAQTWDWETSRYEGATTKRWQRLDGREVLSVQGVQDKSPTGIWGTSENIYFSSITLKRFVSCDSISDTRRFV